MNDDPELLVGIRDADLTDEQRARRDALLAAQPTHAAAHRRALALPRQLQSLPLSQSPPLRRPRRAVTIGLIAAAAAALIVSMPSGERTRALSTEGVSGVILTAAAEDSGVLRPLTSGGSVGASEWVVFQVRTERPGQLRLTEHSPDGRVTVYPPSGEQWSAPAGTHHPGGARPLAWRPDGDPGLRQYVAELCVEGACTEDVMELSWSP